MSHEKTVELIEKVTNVLIKALKEVQQIVGTHKNSPVEHHQTKSVPHKQEKITVSDSELYKDAPKRPKTSFILFSGDIRQKMKDQYADMPIGQVSKVCGKMWEKVEKADKDKYDKQAAILKAKYQKELEAYKNSHPGYNEHKNKKKRNKKEKSRKKEIPDGSLSED